MRPRIPETELAKAVVAYLREYQWEVYQEVVVGGPRADIVGVRGNLLWVVEVKAALSLRLLDQAAGWIGRSHYVSIAVPFDSHPMHRSFAGRFLKQLGIGTLYVRGGSHPAYDPLHAREDEKPAFLRRVDSSHILRSLNEAQKSSVAGIAGGGYWTPFRGTCGELRRFVREHPGCKVKQAIDSIHHHYATPASAVGSLYKLISDGKIEGLVIDGDGRLSTKEES